MTTFALVHGAWHGAWCWRDLAAELQRRGHRTVAVDLPCDDPAAGCAQYAQVVTSALAGTGDDVVVVAHSLGGLTIPLVARARPVRRLVFVAAMLPVPGLSLDDQGAAGQVMTVDGLGDDQLIHPDGSTSWPDPAAAVERFYYDCDPQVALWAARQLRRQCWTPTQEVTPLTAWPAVECRYIVCADDHALRPDWCRTAARERLGIIADELPGGHSPFLSRPADLADVLA